YPTHRSIPFLSVILLTVLGQCAAFYTPPARSFHIASLVKNKVYFQGGIDAKYKTLQDFFWLDLNKSFSRNSPPFQDEQFSQLPGLYDPSSFIGGNNSETIFIFGGLVVVNMSKF